MADVLTPSTLEITSAVVTTEMHTIWAVVVAEKHATQVHAHRT